MRPINKGAWPLDPVGNKVIFNGWGEAKSYLIERTCRYCHFCEMPILNSPAVEHIKNKQYYPNVKNHWENLMLICTYCNSRKPKKRIKLYDYYWPHQHNTFMAFTFNNEGNVIVKMGLNVIQRIKAQSTIDLYGLDKVEDSYGGIDSRYQARLLAFSQAIEALQEYQKQEIKIDAIIRNAISTGFWSIWFICFYQFDEVKERLIQDFKVASQCFDTNNQYLPIPRNPNDL